MLDVKLLRFSLVINLGLCLLLAYKMFNMSLTSPDELSELRALMSGEMNEQDRQSLFTQLFDIVDKLEETRRRLRNIVLRFNVGMIPFFAISLWTAFRVQKPFEDEHMFNSSIPGTS
jgi:hypothetical protein